MLRLWEKNGFSNSTESQEHIIELICVLGCQTVTIKQAHRDGYYISLQVLFSAKFIIFLLMYSLLLRQATNLYLQAVVVWQVYTYRLTVVVCVFVVMCPVLGGNGI